VARRAPPACKALITPNAGLWPALEVLALRSPIPVVLEVLTEGRFPEPVEVAAYFVACESLANAARHSRSTRIDVVLTVENERLLLSVWDTVKPAQPNPYVGTLAEHLCPGQEGREQAETAAATRRPRNPCKLPRKPSQGLEPLTPSLPCAPNPLPWVATGSRSAYLSHFGPVHLRPVATGCARLAP
jgi:hypothetical protein